jgi:hypothetical protein
MNEESLFSQYDIFNVLERQRQSVRKDVDSLAAETILNASEHDLVRALINKFKLHVPVLGNRMKARSATCSASRATQTGRLC